MATEAAGPAQPDAEATTTRVLAPDYAATRPSPPRVALAWATSIKELNIVLTLLVLGAFLSLTSPAFLTAGNLFGVARAFSLTAIAAIGQTLVIITGGIDLSVGSVLALA